MENIPIDKDELYDYFIVQNHTVASCARWFNVPRSTLYRILNNFGFVKNEVDKQQSRKGLASKHKININIQELKRLYLEENLTVQEVATHFGVSQRVITRRLNENGITKPKELRDAVAQRSAKSLFANEEKVDQMNQRRRQTCLEKYDCSTSIASETVRAKAKATILAKYGENGFYNNEDMKQKRRETCLQKYGGVAPASSPEVRKKARESCLTKFGVENYGLSEEHRVSVTKNAIGRFHSADKIEFIFDVIKDAHSMRNFMVENNITTVAQLSEKLDGYSPCRLEVFIHRYNLSDLIVHQVSTGEREVSQFLDSLGIRWTRTREVISPYEIDLYCPDYKIGIEFNGLYFHSAHKKEQNYHQFKSQLAEQNGIKLIHIYEHEWLNPDTRPIVESEIHRAFGKIPHKIQAELCDVREVPLPDAVQFCAQNCLTVTYMMHAIYGLFYEGELIQMMGFAKDPRYEWRSVQRCTKNNWSVVGGYEKLFRYFVQKHVPQRVLILSDFNKLQDICPEQFGAQFFGYTPPNCDLVVRNTVVLKQPDIRKQFPNAAVFQIFGTGNKKFLWTQSKN